MEQNVELLLQVWKELKHHLMGGDVEAAAEDFVHVLLEHGVDADELAAYALDKELKVALRAYTEDDLELVEDDDDELLFDDDD